MPTYEFHCCDCDNVFEVFASISAKEKGLDLTCEKCGSKNIDQNLTSCLFYEPGSFKESRKRTTGTIPAKCAGCSARSCSSCN